jgi:peptidoglycan/LPS O-acetylase OafA/YrhL
MGDSRERPRTGWFTSRVFEPPSGNASVHLDALRGFAAFSVLLSHWRDAFFVDYPKLGHHNPLLASAYLVTGLGRQWVIVFFVLSGYLVGGSVLRSVGAERWSWRSYITARLTRLYVVLLPALLLGGLLDWSGMHLPSSDALYSGHSGMQSLKFDIHNTLTWPALAGNALFVQTIPLPGMHGHRLPTFGSNGPLWSLSNEFWYYLAFPLLVLLIAGAQPAWRRAVFALALAVWGWFCGAAIVLLGITWLMGTPIGYLPPFPATKRWTRTLAAIAALALLGLTLALGKLLHLDIMDYVIGAAVALLIWITLHCATGELPAWYVRLSRRAAHSSYTLYLVHMPLLIFLKAAFNLPRAQPGWHMLLVSLGAITAILVYAQLVYECFEKNTDKVRAWIKPSARRPAVSQR